MAQNYSNKKKGARKKKSKYSDIEKLAYKVGQIDRGRAKDSLIKDSYERGLASGKKEKAPKKTLFGDEK